MLVPVLPVRMAAASVVAAVVVAAAAVVVSVVVVGVSVAVVVVVVVAAVVAISVAVVEAVAVVAAASVVAVVVTPVPRSPLTKSVSERGVCGLSADLYCGFGSKWAFDSIQVWASHLRAVGFESLPRPSDDRPGTYLFT